MASKKPPKPDERRAPLLDAAAQVFLRYGFRKASMDDVAAAAGLSRQALYLRFDSKEGLFRAAVEHVFEKSLSAAESALGSAGRLEDRLLRAFSALHAVHFEHPATAANLTELTEASVAIIGPQVYSLLSPFQESVARVLVAAKAASAREARDMAATLEAASQGIKHRAETLADYQQEMKRVIRVVCRSSTGNTR